MNSGVIIDMSIPHSYVTQMYRMELVKHVKSAFDDADHQKKHRKVTKIEIIQNQQIDSSDTDRTFTHVRDVHTHELDDTWVGSIR